MADLKKVLRAFLVKVTKKPVGDIDAILAASDTEDDDTLVDKLAEVDKARISELTKPKAGQTFQDGYKKAKAEVLTELEGKLKEKYELESDATGEELVDAIVTSKSKAAGKAKELTDDDVRRHPVFQTAEKAHKAALKTVETEFTGKLTAAEQKAARTATLGQVSSKALDMLNAMNPALPANPKVAENLKRAFLQTFDGYEYDLQDNGNRVVVMDKDRKVVDDGHGNSLDFEKMVKDSAANYFEFKAHNGGGNAGNGSADKGAGGAPAAGGAAGVVYPAGVVKPKTFEELVKITSDTALKATDREIVLKTWEAEQKGGTGA